MPEFEMIVGNDGSLRTIYADVLAQAFADDARIKVRRASHVEPVDLPGAGLGWQADMTPVNGPILGPFKSRQEALDAEHAWLLDRDIPFPKEN
jgi:hypothetical protein